MRTASALMSTAVTAAPARAATRRQHSAAATDVQTDSPPVCVVRSRSANTPLEKNRPGWNTPVGTVSVKPRQRHERCRRTRRIAHGPYTRINECVGSPARAGEPAHA